MTNSTRATFALGLALAALPSIPAAAEVVEAEDGHFISRNEAVVDASLTETWLALISPSQWWASEHTWSGDAANLTLTPQAGGCFCEKIPEVNEPDRFTLEGSVEHMRVIQAYPEVALRMTGALGPLQSEPVNGVLTIAITEVATPEINGTRIVWEYNVGGQMRYPVEAISQAVDGVMTLQLTRLSDQLGVLVAPTTPAVPDPDGGPEADPEASEEVGAEVVTDGEPDAPITIDPEAVLEDAEAQEAEKPSGPTVDEAFGDLGGPG